MKQNLKKKRKNYHAFFEGDHDGLYLFRIAFDHAGVTKWAYIFNDDNVTKILKPIMLQIPNE